MSDGKERSMKRDSRLRDALGCDAQTEEALRWLFGLPASVRHAAPSGGAKKPRGQSQSISDGDGK